MTGYRPRSKTELARRVAHDIPDGSYINLGVGMPTEVANYLPPDREIVLHSENGILGMGPAARAGEEDWNLINAGKEPVTLLPGGAFFHHADSFAMVRGRHIDISVLGAYQVSLQGDLANWSTGEAGAIPAIGGAMDLAVGAKKIWVVMGLLARNGASKVVERCSYPLTGVACVHRIYGDLATLEFEAGGLCVLDLVDGLSLGGLEGLLGVPLRAAETLRTNF